MRTIRRSRGIGWRNAPIVCHTRRTATADMHTTLGVRILRRPPFIRLAPPAYDYVGRGGRISVQQGRVLRAVYTEGIHSLIDAAAGAGDSLWDSEDMRQVAQAMADLGAYAVSYTEADMSLATLTPLNEKPRVEFIPPIEYSVSRLTDPPALLPFRAIGSGWGLTSLDKPPHVFLVVVHNSDDAARANAVRLAARLQEGVIARAWDSLYRIDSANRDGDSRRPATGAPGAGAWRKVPLGISDARLVSLRSSRMSRRSASRRLQRRDALDCHAILFWSRHELAHS